MKYWMCLFLFFSSSVFARALIRGLLLEVTRETQVFEKASKKSKVLADVSVGAPLLLHHRSPKGTWLYVEDEGGNKAWIAAAHTNFVRVQELQKLPPPQTPEEQAQEKADELEDFAKNQKEVRASQHEFAFLTRDSWVDPNAKWSYGPSYTYFFLKGGWPGDRVAQAGFQMGYLFNTARSGEFSIPMRLRYSVTSHSIGLFTGPDVGVTVLRVQPSKIHYSMSLGYSVGFHISHRAHIWLRPGVDLFYATRFSTELGVALRL